MHVLEPASRRRLRVRALLLTALVMVAMVAWAGTVQIQWDNPSQEVTPPVTITLPIPEQVMSPVPEAEALEEAPSPEPPPVEKAAALDSEPLEPASIKNENVQGAFMGIRESTHRVVIAFDVAESVRRKAESAGVPLETIREQAAALVSSLDHRSSFVLLQFVRRYEQFPREMQAASPGVRQQALSWLHNSFRTDGRSGSSWTGGQPDGVELVLLRALDLNPEVIFIISDGDFQRTRGSDGRSWENVTWRELEVLVAKWQIRRGERVRIHVIGIKMEAEHQKEARRFVARFGGQLRLID